MKLLRRLFLSLAALSLTTAPLAAASNSVVCIVNGRPILKSEVEDLMRSRIIETMRTATSREDADAKLKILRSEVTDILIEQELILSLYEPMEATYGPKIEAHAEERIRSLFIGEMFKGDRKKFLQTLQEGGISYKKFFEQQKKNVVVEMMRAQFAKPDQPYITDDERAAWLRKNHAKFRSDPKLKLWSITIPGIAPGRTPDDQMALAKEIRASLVKGADFSSLARTHSADSKRDDGGSWGWVEKKDMAAIFWPILTKLPAGKVSEITPFEGSLYVFWVEARQEGQMKDKALVDQAVERGIMAERREEAAKKWIATLKAKAVIRKP